MTLTRSLEWPSSILESTCIVDVAADTSKQPPGKKQCQVPQCWVVSQSRTEH